MRLLDFTRSGHFVRLHVLLCGNAEYLYSSGFTCSGGSNITGFRISRNQIYSANARVAGSTTSQIPSDSVSIKVGGKAAIVAHQGYFIEMPTHQRPVNRPVPARGTEHRISSPKPSLLLVARRWQKIGEPASFSTN
jgi:hypothetical protein